MMNVPGSPSLGKKHTEDLPGNCILYKSNVKRLWGQVSPGITLTGPFSVRYKALYWVVSLSTLEIEANNRDRKKFLPNVHKQTHPNSLSLTGINEQ